VLNFIAVALPELASKYVKYYTFVTSLLSCPVMFYPVYTFFLAIAPSSHPWTILIVYGLNDASSPKDVPFRSFDNDPQF